MQNFKILQQPLLGELAMSRKKERERRKKIPLAPMGALAHRLRMLDRSLVPPSTQAEIVCRVTFKHLPHPSQVIS